MKPDKNKQLIKMRYATKPDKANKRKLRDNICKTTPNKQTSVKRQVLKSNQTSEDTRTGRMPRVRDQL